MPPDIERLWLFLPLGYLLTILLETPVLLVGLARPHSFRRRLFAGLWLTACTYPIVVLVLPLVVLPTHGYSAYVAVAELFAPAAECCLFWLAFDRADPTVRLRDTLHDMAAIVTANLTSWLLGAWLIDKIW